MDHQSTRQTNGNPTKQPTQTTHHCSHLINVTTNITEINPISHEMLTDDFDAFNEILHLIRVLYPLDITYQHVEGHQDSVLAKLIIKCNKQATHFIKHAQHLCTNYIRSLPSCSPQLVNMAEQWSETYKPTYSTQQPHLTTVSTCNKNIIGLLVTVIRSIGPNQTHAQMLQIL